MKKCDLKIDFYRPDREYKAGETVQGWVRVSVNKELQCRGLYLNCFWKTHGRGNTARKNYCQQTLFLGNWKPGEQYEYTFEFQPPDTPQTYHGKYLNIDHFVSVRADIPWAIDPRQEEEFLLRQGTGSVKIEQDDELVLDNSSSCGMRAGLFGALLLTTAAIFLAFYVLWVSAILIVAALLAVFVSVRQTMAERKLGEVKWTTMTSCVAGQTMLSSLEIGPVGNARIKRILVAVDGKEVVVSGSGTDRTTHSHSIHSEFQTLVESPGFRRGETIELDPEIRFPATNAASLDLPDNQVVWTVTLSIQIEMWPDWTDARTIRLLPAPIPETVDNNPNPAFAAHTLHELVAVARQLVECGNNPQLIDQVIGKNADKLFTISLEIDRVGPTETGFDDPEYATGRTMTGWLTGTRHQVAMQLPTRYNEEVDKLEGGQTWPGTAALIRWEPLAERMTVLGM